MIGLLKAEYLFRPSQVLRRLAYAFKSRSGFTNAMLPWGSDIRIHWSDAIGRGIALTGVYDLLATEALWRLVEPGDCVVDVGANIGYMTSIMVKRTGHRGKVVAIEPHRDIVRQLQANIERFKQRGLCEDITVLVAALSNYVGRGTLRSPSGFEANRGLAFLDCGVPKANCRSTDETCQVDVTTMDILFSDTEIDVVKIDVEGHESEVLSGAQQLLARHQIRDILLEEHRPYIKSRAAKMLSEHGYTVFSLAGSLFRPILQEGGRCSENNRRWDPPNLIATVDPDRVIIRMSKAGWQCLA